MLNLKQYYSFLINLPITKPTNLFGNLGNLTFDYTGKRMRLHLFGASGSGVTTLGHKLSMNLTSPYFDTDSYHWVPTYPPFTSKRPPHERHTWLVSDLTKQESWILGGTVYNWGEYWRSAFDLAVYLWVPKAIRLERLYLRELERGPLVGVAAEQSKFFLDWAAHYDEGDLPGRSRARHEVWMGQLHCPILRIEGDIQIEERVELIQKKISQIAPSFT